MWLMAATVGGKKFYHVWGQLCVKVEDMLLQRQHFRVQTFQPCDRLLPFT